MPDRHPPTVNGISEADYQQWRHSPVSRWLLQYLNDYAEDQGERVKAAWYSGKLDHDLLVFMAEARGRATTALEFAGLKFDDVQTFYGGSDQDKAAEIAATVEEE